MSGSAARVLAFAGKEAREIVAQPRLLVTLIVGPFFVLLAFGAGLADRLPVFTTLFVAPPGSETAALVEQNAGQLADYIDYAGITGDREEAEARLLAGDVDIVAVLPADPYRTVRADRRAVIEVYHDAADPIVAAAIEAASRLAADEINRQLLADVVARSRGATELLDEALPGATAALDDLAELAEEGRLVEAERALSDRLTRLARLLRRFDDLLPVATPVDDALRDVARAVADVRDARATVGLPERLEQLGALEERLRAVDADLTALREIRPEVLIRPFRAVSAPVTSDDITPFDFYLPAVLMLLFQHLGVSMAALAIVRERDLGTVEVFGVAAVSPGEILAGKTLGYLAVGGGVAAVVVTLLRHVLDVPFAGSVPAALAGMLGVLVASIGLGFLVSLLSRTDSQAVQLAMLSVISSFFFSGFFLALERMTAPVRAVGRLLPATHGIEIARDVLLRGRPLPLDAWWWLVGIAVVTLGVTWLGFRRQLRLD